MGGGVGLRTGGGTSLSSGAGFLGRPRLGGSWARGGPCDGAYQTSHQWWKLKLTQGCHAAFDRLTAPGFINIAFL
jgi:hypothetical protein